MAHIDRIKYDAPSDEEFVWKWPNDQISFGAQLIVNESQNAVFVRSGQVLDTFGPGTHTLSTGNLPLLTKILEFPFGGKSPFAAEVWFVNQTIKRGIRWGTPAPVPVMDPTLGFPVSLRSFGTWGFRIEDAFVFVKKVVGTQTGADAGRIVEYFIGEILQRFSAALAGYFGRPEVSIFNVNAQLNELSKFVENELREHFREFGIDPFSFHVENINVPDDELQRIQEVFGKKLEIEQLSQTQIGQGYVTARTLDTLEKAAENPNGAAGGLLAGGIGLGAGLGAGSSLGKQLGDTLDTGQQDATSQGSGDDSVERLRRLKTMLDEGLITEDEYAEKRKAILDEI